MAHYKHILQSKDVGQEPVKHQCYVSADPNVGDEPMEPRNQSFTFLDIQSITDSFNKVIGKGGFGTVFYGSIGNNQVAVKMLSQSSSQGYREFQAEVRLLMTVHHKNITSLVGYCNEGSQKGIIYEYMANGNLGMHLFDGSLNVLSWKKRIAIAYDAAQGNIEKLIDPRLHGDFDINTAWKVVELALACVDNISIERPTINDVVTDLKSCLKSEKGFHGDKPNKLDRHMALSLESMQGPNLR
ncbi:leucine-rich repeat transmembrane protein kinase protein [Artemisia annua]|uniref:Leucine-rich repeat transmembrane protein kinase protein n=1 Tax=Artemisia annua TaxID=35608 RepID=A0A2U1L2U9_ARTAN|nr:leucine-rich repeat transmembrane protein kinase protein [Artemisia annua]